LEDINIVALEISEVETTQVILNIECFH